MSRIFKKDLRTIRPARPDDFSSVFALLEQLWPDRILSRERLLDIFRKGLNSPRMIYLCLLVDGRILGFCSLDFSESFWQEGYLVQINELVIDKEFRGKGYGSFLIRHAIALGKKQGSDFFLLDSDFHRLKAHEFYTKQGFKKTGYIFKKNLG